MTGRRRARITVDQLRHSGRLSGPVRAIHPVLRATGVAWQWDARTSTYLVPRQQLDDILAALELAGHEVDVTMPGWS